MVTVSGDGRILEHKPWSLFGVIGSFFDAVYHFFETLLSPSGGRSRTTYSNGGSGSSGYGGSGRAPYTPGGNRRIGTLGSLNSRAPNMSSCASCR